MLKAVDQTFCYPKDLSEQTPAKYILSVGLRHFGAMHFWVDEILFYQNGIYKAVKGEPEEVVITFPMGEPWFLINPSYAELITNEQLYEVARSNAVDGTRMTEDMERLLKHLKRGRSWSEENEEGR